MKRMIWTLIVLTPVYTGHAHAQAAAGSQSTTLLFTRYTLGGPSPRASAPILITSASVRHCSFSIMRAL